MSKLRLVSDNDGDEEREKYKFTVEWIDGDITEYIGEYLGHSEVHAPMIIILDGEGKEQFPVAILNSDLVREITVEIAELTGELIA